MKRGWIALTAAAVTVELLTATGTQSARILRLRQAVLSGELAQATLALELGLEWERALPELVWDEPEASPPGAGPVSAPTSSPAPTAVPTPTSFPAPTPVPAAPVPQAAASPVPSPASPEPETAVFSNRRVNNRTKLSVDVNALQAQQPDVHLRARGAQILILHTHGTEAYTQSGSVRYTESDAYRTTDTAYNVVHLGDVLAEEWRAMGLEVVHDRGLYDYPSYTGSYNRAATAIEGWLEQYPELAVVIDLHRDALGSGDVIYKTRAEVPGQSAAQVMLLVGTGENGLEHPRWQENFKLALQMQTAMEQSHPTLARPIDLVSERYNQHYTTGSLILEVGSSGNTLAEAESAVRLFARAVYPVLQALRDRPV